MAGKLWMNFVVFCFFCKTEEIYFYERVKERRKEKSNRFWGNPFFSLSFLSLKQKSWKKRGDDM